MARLTKASFAAAKRRLGIKKVTKKNIGRIARAARRGLKGRRKRAAPKTRRARRTTRKGVGRRMGRARTVTLGVVSLSLGAKIVAEQGPKGNPLYEMGQGNWAGALNAALANAAKNAPLIAAAGIGMGLVKRMFGNPTILKIGNVRITAF